MDRGATRSAYAGRTAVLATMHGKERAIVPPLRAALGLTVVPAAGIDTDRLGTFTGEVPRRGTMLEVAVAKARLGMAAAGMSLGLASEGSFGPHPAFVIVPAGLELLVFVDDDRGLVVHESLIAEQTNFDSATVGPDDDLDSFLGRVGFPSHGLIVRADVGPLALGLVKGIVEREALDRAIAAAIRASANGRARIETDMRAHLNPTRMESLGRLAERLARRLATPCPACGAPGFGRIETRIGLPCESCGTPTGMVAAEIFGCAVCDRRDERPRGDGLAAAPQQYCPACNP